MSYSAQIGKTQGVSRVHRCQRAYVTHSSLNDCRAINNRDGGSPQFGTGGNALPHTVSINAAGAGVVFTSRNAGWADTFQQLSFQRADFDNAKMSESRQLLHEQNSDSEDDLALGPHAGLRHLSPSPTSSRATSTSPAYPGTRPNGNGFNRQSSFAHPRPDGTPRTPNRVRFDEDPVRRSMNGGTQGAEWIELEGEDYMDAHGDGGRERVQRLPLLTGIEAPSVTVAADFDPEDHLESAKPRSGMRSSFMNMANSIM